MSTIVCPEVVSRDMIEREQWLLDRRSGLGSTDAAPVLGLSQWRTDTEVWLDKLGRLPDRPPTKGMRWGLKLEEAIAEAYMEETGRAVVEPEEKIQRHPVYPWLICSIDRDGPPKDNLVVELKSCHHFARKRWGEEGTDAIPIEYVCQVQHQMAVTGAQRADVAVLIGGQDFRIYHVERSDRFISGMIERLAEFWELVKSETPPPIDTEHPRALEMVRNMYGITEGLECRLDDPQLVDLVERYARAGELVNDAKADKDRIRCELLAAMRDAEVCRLADGTTLRRRMIQPVEIEAHTRAGYPQLYIWRPTLKKARAK